MTLYYMECNHCSNNILTDTSCDLTVCNDCIDDYYTCCECCSEYVDNDDTRHLDGHGPYCEPCFDRTSSTCEECEETFHVNDLSGGRCESCQEDEENEDDDDIIRPYHYDRPDRLFHRIGANGPHYGLELEVEVRSDFDRTDVAESLLKDIDPEYSQRWVVKEDGSLYHGLELESLPMTKAAIQDDLKAIEKYSNRLKGFHGHNCGLHVNCDRPASRMHQYKIAKFMHHSGHRWLLELVGQRELNSYCYQEPITASLFTGWNKCPANSKHGAVAFTGSRVEFRIFKANLLPQRINKAIDFCQAVIDFAEQVSIDELHVGGFLHYVWKNRWKYVDLVDFLLEKSPGLFGHQTGKAQYRQARIRKMIRIDGLPVTNQTIELPELIET